jgi:hypothetical protein
MKTAVPYVCKETEDTISLDKDCLKKEKDNKLAAAAIAKAVFSGVTQFQNLNCNISKNEGPEKIQFKCTVSGNHDIKKIIAKKDTSPKIIVDKGLQEFVIVVSELKVTMKSVSETILTSADEYKKLHPKSTFIQLDPQEPLKTYEFTFSINNIAMEGNSSGL